MRREATGMKDGQRLSLELAKIGKIMAERLEK